MNRIKYYFLKYQPYILGLVFFSMIFLIWRLGNWLGFSSFVSLLSGILVFLVLSAFYVLLMYRGVSRYANLEQLLLDDADQAVLDASTQDREEVGLLREKLLQTLERLRTSHKNDKGKGKGNKAHDALYALPWYLIIGQSAAGKSTMLYQSGLNFPYADRDGIRVSGLGGTRNCDWFFSSDAILLDTAGRYVSHQEDSGKWKGFLKLLSLHRRQCPLNGVIVVVSIQDLLQANESRRKSLALRLRERLQELHDMLGLRLPIYLVFSKCDLVPGFTAFYQQLDRSIRGEVMGKTFAHQGYEEADWEQRFSSAMDDLTAYWQQIAHQQLVAQDIRITRNDSAIYRFPNELAALKPILQQFMANLLSTNPYQSPELLRGFYFTCAQHADEPDVGEHARWVVQRFALTEEPQKQNGETHPHALFINSLFKKVIIPDQHLVSLYTNHWQERRRKLLHTSLVVIGGVLLCCLWGWSYWGNLQLSQQISAELNDAVDRDRLQTAQYTQWHTLDTLRYWASHYYALHHDEGIPLKLRMGLYQGYRIEPVLRQRYFSRLETIMLKPTAENLTRSLYLLPTISVYQRNTSLLSPVSGIDSVEARALPADNRAESVAGFGKTTLETYRMISTSYDREKADSKFLKEHIPDYWYPAIADRQHYYFSLPTETAQEQSDYLMAGQQVNFYSDQIREPDVPRIMDNAFLVSSSRNYINSLLSQSLHTIETITLESDTLFAFGRADFQSLRRSGQARLNQLASKLLNTPNIGKLVISGHADQIGDAEDNQRLSKQRAMTIKTYLVGKGIPQELIETIGEGSSKPLVFCSETQSRQELINCLEPNRRVEIEVRTAN